MGETLVFREESLSQGPGHSSMGRSIVGASPKGRIDMANFDRPLLCMSKELLRSLDTSAQSNGFALRNLRGLYASIFSSLWQSPMLVRKAYTFLRPRRIRKVIIHVELNG